MIKWKKMRGGAQKLRNSKRGNKYKYITENGGGNTFGCIYQSKSITNCCVFWWRQKLLRIWCTTISNNNKSSSNRVRGEEEEEEAMNVYNVKMDGGGGQSKKVGIKLNFLKRKWSEPFREKRERNEWIIAHENQRNEHKKKDQLQQQQQKKHNHFLELERDSKRND